jgi:hypothetical protein
VATVRAQLDADSFADAWASGLALSTEQSISLAIEEIQTALSTA